MLCVLTTSTQAAEQEVSDRMNWAQEPWTFVSLVWVLEGPWGKDKQITQ